MRAPHTHTVTVFRDGFTQATDYTFHSIRKYGKSVALLFCLTLGTLYTSSWPLSSTGSLVFSLKTQGSRQNDMETTSPFLLPEGEPVISTHAQYRPSHRSRCRWYREIQKLLKFSPHPGKAWVCEAAAD